MTNQVTLNNKKYSIRFTYSVLAEIERETGKSFLNFDPDKLNVGDCIIMAYYGCRKADKEFNLSAEQVGDYFTGETFTEVFTAFAHDMQGESKKK